MKKVLLYFILLTHFVIKTSAQIFDTIVIGNQIWMAKNLDTDKYANGDIIQNVESAENWEISGRLVKDGAWCFYNNNPENGTSFGRLYNWYAVADPRGLCPSGWHVSTVEDWDIYLNELKKVELQLEEIDAIQDKEIFHPAEYKKEFYFEEEGGYKSQVRCSNCANWNEEYMAKVPCHICKDNRYVSGPYIPKKMVKKERQVLVKEARTEIVKADRPPKPDLPNLQLAKGGLRYRSGGFLSKDQKGFWWRKQSTPHLWIESNINEARTERFDPATGTLGEYDKRNPCNEEGSLGLSVRCVRGVDRIQVSSKNPVISLSLINQKGQAVQFKEIISENDFNLLIVSEELFDWYEELTDNQKQIRRSNWFGKRNSDYEDFQALSNKYKLNICGIAGNRMNWESWMSILKIISRCEEDPSSILQYRFYTNKIKSTSMKKIMGIQRFSDTEEVLNKRGHKYFLFNGKEEVIYEGSSLSDLSLLLDNLKLLK